jgi:hypothetical protein
MKDMKEEESSSRLIQDVLTQGDTLFSQLVAEVGAVKAMGTVDPDVQRRRNELLLKIQDKTTEVKSTLQRVDMLQKQLKQHLASLQQLSKILSK